MIDLDFFFADDLLSGPVLEHVQQLLSSHASSWSAGTHRFVEGEPRVAVDMARPHSLRAACAEEVRTTGSTFQALEARFGVSSRRTVGTAELRGTDRSLIVFIHADEAARDGSRWTNQVSIQVRKQRVEGKPASEWCEAFFRDLSNTKTLVYARAASPEEFEHKNIVSDEAGVRAVGVDFAHGLPGLYWLTAIGQPYLEQIKKERLLSCPAEKCIALEESFLIYLSNGPEQWNTESYARTERAARDWLGHEHFFSK